MEKVRIQKLIAQSGYCSRRKAEEYIASGRVTRNGRKASIGDKADPVKDIIAIDGEKITFQNSKELYYIMLNKPRGYITTMSDEQGRRCVADLISDFPHRVYPVGRLDVNSEGLLLFTNDGLFANDIMHPARHVAKRYRVTVKSDVKEEQLTQLASGVVIDGRTTQPAEVRVLTKEPERVVLEIIIREGRNRQIRKMLEAVGLSVARLKRTAIGPLKLGMLRPGKYRRLTKEEVRAIRAAIKKTER